MTSPTTKVFSTWRRLGDGFFGGSWLQIIQFDLWYSCQTYTYIQYIHIYAVYNGVSPDLCVHWIPREISELNQVFKDLSCFVIWLGRLATNMVVTCNLKRKIVDYYMKILVNITSKLLCFPTIWMWSFGLWLCLLNDYRTFSWNCPLTSERVVVNDSSGLDICRSGGYFTSEASYIIRKRRSSSIQYNQWCRTGCSWWNAPLTKLQCRRVAHGRLKEALTPSGRMGINLSPFMILFASFFRKMHVHDSLTMKKCFIEDSTKRISMRRKVIPCPMNMNPNGNPASDLPGCIFCFDLKELVAVSHHP